MQWPTEEQTIQWSKEGQTIQWPKEKGQRVRINNDLLITTQKTKDRALYLNIVMIVMIS